MKTTFFDGQFKTDYIPPVETHRKICYVNVFAFTQTNTHTLANNSHQELFFVSFLFALNTNVEEAVQRIINYYYVGNNIYNMVCLMTKPHELMKQSNIFHLLVTFRSVSYFVCT